MAEGLRLVPRREVVAADKTNAHTYDEGVQAVEHSLNDLDTEYVDVMFLHIVPPEPVERRDAAGRPYVSGPLSRRMGALNAFMDVKETGTVRATALSTPSTETLRQALGVPEIDVVCTTLNMTGAYIDDGTLDNRIDAIRDLHDDGRFLYVIKILDAGRLRDRAEEAIRYAPVPQVHRRLEHRHVRHGGRPQEPTAPRRRPPVGSASFISGRSELKLGSPSLGVP